MSKPNAASLVLGFPSYQQPAERLARAARLDYADVAIHRFPDGESLVRLPPRLPEHVAFCVSLNDPNAKLVELELAAAAALTLGAERLTLVTPYLGYMRQDTAFHPGEAVSQRIVGALLARHFDTVVTVDPHLHRTPELSGAVPVRRAVALSAGSLMAAWLRNHTQQPLLVGPDEESEQWVRAIAAASGLEYGVARKRRLGDREVRLELPALAFAGRAIVLIDDIASTGRSLMVAAEQLRTQGVASIAALVTHALFVGGSLERVKNAGVREICSTDSVPHETNGMYLDELLAAALREG
jgi:ribose-phosphate pyrophosphokinase